jgi:PleD family two-component response regulator
VVSADDAAKLVAAADVQLYSAKNSGRNRVSIATDPFVTA